MLVAVGALGPGIWGATSVALALGGAEAGETGLNVGKDTTPRKVWSSVVEPSKTPPWVPPEVPLLEGRVGAAQSLAAGDLDSAVARLPVAAHGAALPPLPASDDVSFEDQVVSRVIAGRALLGSRRPAEAVAVLESLEGLRGLHKYIPLDVYTYELARARMQLAEATSDPAARDALFVQTATALRKGLRLDNNRYRKPMEVMRAAALAGNEGRTPRERKKASLRSVRALEESAADYPDHADRWWWDLQRARALDRWGRTKDARAVLREVTIEASGLPESRMAWLDLTQLAEREGARSVKPWTHNENLARARAALRHRGLDTAQRLINELWDDPSLPNNLRSKVRELRADISYRAHDYEQCVADRRALFERSASPDRRKSLSRCLERAERYEEAIELWEAVANDRARNRHNRTAALWTGISLAMRGAKYERARGLLGKYEKRSRGHVAQRRYIRTWIAYRLGDFEEALAGFTTIEKRDSERASMARYYRGKVAIRLGTPEGSREGTRILRTLAQEAPFQYYGLQARTLLEHHGEVAPPLPRLEPLDDEGRYMPFAEVLNRLAGLDEAYGAAVPSLARTHQLYRVGFIEEARREFRIAADGMLNTKTRLSGRSIRKSRTEAYTVGAGWEGDWKRWSPSLSVAGRALVRDSDRRPKLWEEMREVAKGLNEPYRWIKFTGSPAGSRVARWHPRAFRQTVEREADAFAIDPTHLWSLMYTESRFRRFVVSYVGARGAIQIMPVTERRLLELEHGFPGHVDHDDLFDIDHNVHLASLYISELIKKFRGQEAFAYASYNAGPSNVARWLRARDGIEGLELDDFVEEIPFKETYRYTKRVLEVRAAYQGLYNEDRADIAREVDVRIGNNINF